MREIIANTLSKYNIGNVPKEALKYELMRASLKKEERVLSVDITLNFVVPIKACNEMLQAFLFMQFLFLASYVTCFDFLNHFSLSLLCDCVEEHGNCACKHTYNA